MKSLLIILALLPSLLFGQVQSYLGRADSDTVPEQYRFDSNILREQVYNKLPKILKDDFKTNRRSLIFAQDASLLASDLLSGGQLYIDWPELENYLNRILKRIMPEELKGDSGIHVYVAKNGDRNAFMLPSGHILMNIGFIAEAPSEAMIAMTLLHELAHYYKNHSIDIFLETTQSSHSSYYYLNSKRHLKNSVEKEIQADLIAMNWLVKTGYSLNGCKWFFETEILENENLISRYRDLWKIEEHTHPLPENRLTKLKEFIANHENYEGFDNLENDSLLSQFRISARIESLKYLLRSMNYFDCIEKGFKFHLFEPGNAGYLYYIIESIRRLCYLNRNIWNENFITNRYYVRDSTSIKPLKKPMEQHLFATFSTKLLSIPDSDTLNIKTRRYWHGTPDFITYEQAFVYFYNLSQLQQMHEAVLSNALSFSNNKMVRDKLLKKYLSYDQIRHREFAQNLLADSIYSSLDTNRLIVFYDFSAIIKLNKEELEITRQPTDTIDIIEEIVTKTANEFPGCQATQLKSLMSTRSTEAQLLNYLFRFSRRSLISNEEIELAQLDPEIWEQYRKYNVSRIDFINCRYSDPGGLWRNVDRYRNMIEAGLTPLFYPPARQRFMKIELSSLIMTKNGSTRRYNYDTTTFGNIMVSTPEISKEVAEMLKDLEKPKQKYYYFTY